ncbi:hypothetical protein BDW69DRAFT_204460 [Aspergillus filifer]
MHPLSDQASALLDQPTEGNLDQISLTDSLKTLILRFERLFELRVRSGLVFKCNDQFYLAENASDLPGPKPHGLFMLGSLCVMFMSFVPGVTLDAVWPSLSHETKSPIQSQLDSIFGRLRSLSQDDGKELGGVSGKGVKDYRISEIFAHKGITTARGFNEFQFSAKHCASPCYVTLLRSFLKDENEALRGSVFTHGDLKKSNIMVQQDIDDADAYIITGIIDWEDSGFYPEVYECTTLSNGQSIISDDDWYLYAPDCISLLRHPVRWLVDRLWGNLLWNWRTDIVR